MAATTRKATRKTTATRKAAPVKTAHPLDPCYVKADEIGLKRNAVNVLALLARGVEGTEVGSLLHTEDGKNLSRQSVALTVRHARQVLGKLVSNDELPTATSAVAVGILMGVVPSDIETLTAFQRDSLTYSQDKTSGDKRSVKRVGSAL